MYEDICRLLAREGVRIVQTTSRVFGRTLKGFEEQHPFIRSEVSVNAKTVFEVALAGAYASKRVACVIPTQGIYEALDPIMSSAYTGVAGGFLLLCLKEIEEEATPVGLFAKLPVIVAEGTEALDRAVAFGYDISERYRIPVILQTPIWPGRGQRASGADSVTPRTDTSRISQFIKDPGRWAAIPKFRYELHRELNAKIEKIREEFETYEGNVIVRKESTGVITYTPSAAGFFDDEASMLCLSTVFPLPVRLVDSFIADMDEVFMAEGPYPVIELQIGDRSRVFRGPSLGARKETKPEETMYGFVVVRDIVGAGSSINMAHGIKKIYPEKKVLAITFEDFIFDTGLPNLVNTMYNGTSYVLLVLASTREEEMKRLFSAYGFDNCVHIDDIREIERFQDEDGMTILFYKGII